MENIVVKGSITAMSNKQSKDFKQEVPAKTVYIHVADAIDIAKLEAFGLTLYTPESDGEPFFAMKASKEISVYTTDEINAIPSKMDMTVEAGKSFKTTNGIEIKMNIIKGENKGNKFFRLQAIKLNSPDDIEEIKATNPFESDF